MRAVQGARGQRGLTLVELMVALTLLLIAMATSLALYSASWDSFKQGENAAEQQQGVRIAFEKICLDVQMAGYNTNPDGDDERPDEQIEAAYDTAIAIRGDFDTEAEPALAGDAFDIVSTGNDEIVVYVLGKPDGTSPGTLTLRADLAEAQRDGGVETVSVPNVAMVQDAPPYSLYRITFSNDPTDWGTGDFFVRETLAVNIGSMTFRYYDRSGSQINSTFDLGSTSDDIGADDSAADDRARIDRIEIELRGLAPDPNPQWLDLSDPDPATARFRKFDLASRVRPQNLGLIGIPDIVDTPDSF